MRSSLLLFATLLASTSASFAHHPLDIAVTGLLRRQAPGTPEYDCHANCGGVITISRTENYCTNTTFTTELEACLECALEFDIWQYYGDSVSTAAQACGVDATPLPANATTTGAANSTTVPTATVSSGSSTAGGATTTATSVSATEASATAASTGSAETASGTSSATAATSSFPGAGNQVLVSGALFAVPLGMILVEWL